MEKKTASKRVVSVFLMVALLITAFSVPAFAQSEEIANSDYQVYDAETGEVSYHSFSELPAAVSGNDGAYSPGYFPNGAEPFNPISPFAIVGTDNRTRVNPTTVGPYCNTVQVYATFSDGTYKIGSGFMIGPSAVATAAHCVYDSGHGGNAASVTITPAKNGATLPYGSTTFKKLVVGTNYTAGNANNDWAVVELNDALGNKTGWLGLKWQSGSYNDTFVYNTGYPSPDTTEGQQKDRYMFKGTGYVKSTSTNTFKGDWDASAGNSGGPVFAYYSDLGYTAIGILTSGSAGSTDGSSYPTAYSTATRITQDMYNLFMSYR